MLSKIEKGENTLIIISETPALLAQSGKEPRWTKRTKSPEKGETQKGRSRNEEGCS